MTNEISKTADYLKYWQPLLDAINEPLCLTDQSHTIIQCNTAFSSLVAKPLSDVIGSPCWQIVPHQDENIEKWPFKQLNQAQERAKTIRQIREKWFQVTVNPIFDVHGSYVCSIYIFSDISEQKTRETQAREKAALLSSIINGIQDGISVLDSDLNIVFTNDRVNELLADDETATGKKCFQVYHHRQTPCEDCASLRALESGERESSEVSFIDRENNELTLELLVFPVKNEDGVVTNIIEYVRDITGKKNQEETLRRKNRALAALSQCREALRSAETETQFLENICQIVVDTGRYLLAWVGFAQNNQEKSIETVAQEVYKDVCLGEITISWGEDERGKGPTATAIRERRVVVCRGIHDDPCFEGWREAALQCGYASSLAIPLFVDDKIKGALNIYSRHHDAFDSEEIQLFEELATDVGIGIKNFQEMAARKNAELQLRQAEKMEAIGTLAGGIAHDFNNILSPILGFTQMVKENLPEGSGDRKDLEVVYQSAVRAQKLVKQILTFSRQDESHMLPCMITPLIKEAIKFIRSSLPTSIEIKQNFTNDLVLVTANTTFIHQIVMNLCTNSFHAMEESGGTLSVSLQQRRPDQIPYNFTPKADLYAVLTVEDTGTGVEPEILGKMYEPYFTTKEQGKGTGLGLFVVYGIIEKLRGEIFFESKVGEGTTVQVLLPVTSEDSLSKQVDNIQLPRGTETILVVDDEEFVSRPTERILAKLGYDVISKNSSIEALDFFNKEKERIDLVITDQTMPKMTGAQLAEKILRAKKGIPIILMTGYHGAMDEKKAREIGFKAFFMKPVRREKLAQTVRRLLDGDDIFRPDQSND